MTILVGALSALAFILALYCIGWVLISLTERPDEPSDFGDYVFAGLIASAGIAFALAIFFAIGDIVLNGTSAGQ